MTTFFFHQGVSSQKRGANGKAIGEYPPIEVADVTRWKEPLPAINEGRRVTWAQFLSLLRIHRVTAQFCTCATYSTLGICHGILLWLPVKEPGFVVPLRYSWKYIGVRPFRQGRVRRTVASCVEPPHVHELKSQASPSKKKGNKRVQRVVEDESSSDSSCDGQPLSLAQDVKCELAQGHTSWHSMRLYRPPFTCGQCNKAVYLWCIFCDGCINCLVGLDCLARQFKDRDEVKWVLQKWEKKVDAETTLHPTPSMSVDASSTSVASCAEAASTPLDLAPSSSISLKSVTATDPTQSVNEGGSSASVDSCAEVVSTPLDLVPPTSNIEGRTAEQMLANVCKALSDSHSVFRPSLPEVEALLAIDWGQPLHVTAPS